MRHLFKPILLMSLVVVLMSTACQVPTANTGSQPNTNTAVATAPPAQRPEQRLETSATNFTLPKLDALLADESFVSDAKNSVPMTDDVIEHLRDISRKAVAELSDQD